MSIFSKYCARRMRQRSCAGGLGTLLMAAVGCVGDVNEEQLPVFPVTGQIHVDGRPADDALVVFHPTSSSPPSPYRPAGRTGADGRFTLSTYESGDGAPVGEYQVTIVWPSRPAGPNPDVDLAPDRLRGRYAIPARSQLRVRCEEKENVLPAFDLKSRP